MKGILINLKKYFGIILRIFVFLIAAGIVVYVLPRERKFDLEYRKGSPWQYEDLTANFNFSIYKSDARLAREQDSILKMISPYFNYNAHVNDDKLSLFFEDFNKSWLAYSMREFRIDEEAIYKTASRYKLLRDLQKNYSELIYSKIEDVYKSGIIRIPDEKEFTLDENTLLKVIRGNLVEDIYVNQLYTPKAAYSEIIEFIRDELNKDTRRQILRYDVFFEELKVADYLSENVIFNKEKTDNEKSDKLRQLSLTTGQIQEGELIVSRGVLITQQTYNILESYKREYSRQLGNVSNLPAWGGRLLLTLISFLVVYLFLYNFRREILESLLKTSFILFLMVSMLFIASTVSKINGNRFFYIVPFAILPIIIRTFYDERVALFMHVITVLLAGFMATNSYEFVFLNIVAGMVALFSLKSLYHRSRFFLAAIFITLAYSLTYFGMSVVREGSFVFIEWTNFKFFAYNGIAILPAFLLIFIFEKTFGFLSDTTLMELSDTNQPLLRKLAETAPATFQHSMQVANLAEEAVRSIGGNPMLVRTGALYHDIGKMIDSSYFTENQGEGPNPHAEKDLRESARIIIDHVSKGEELARKNNLPQPIIDFITTHHGTSSASFFEKTFKNQNPGIEYEKSDFQYPGPKPMSKENAVLMMADSVEAASRSLEKYTSVTIDELVERIVNSKMAEGQFEDADITFRDIKRVKEIFKGRLKHIYHARIAYPK